MKNKVIAVDFDQTITGKNSVFPAMDSPNMPVVKLMRKWYKDNIILIWTSRSGEYIGPMKEYLSKHNIPYHHINKNPYNDFNPESRKIYADFYIDDKAINPYFMSFEEFADEFLKE